MASLRNTTLLRAKLHRQRQPSMSQYEIFQDHELKLVRVVARGDLSRALGVEIITKARLLAAESGYNILYDMRDSVTRVAMFEWYDLPRTLDVLQKAETRRARVAVLYPAHSSRDFLFYEDTAANAGLNVKVFLDEAEALAWLK